MTFTTSDPDTREQQVFAQEFLSNLRKVLPSNKSLTPLHEPFLGASEQHNLRDCLESGWVSSAGPYVEQFEQALARIHGVNHAIACVNGTSALHLGLKILGVRPGDEVIVPALTFVGTANAAAYCGATPHFADCDPQTFGMDPQKLCEYLSEVGIQQDDGFYNQSTGKRIAAIVPMHCFGHPVDFDPISSVASRYRVPILEDAAQALGTRYKDRPTASLAPIAALSFNGNKIVTTGGGGALLTNNESLAQAARHLSTTAKLPHEWEFYHDEVGFNYRMPNINAALGCAQLERLDDFLVGKRQLARLYREAFNGFEGLYVFSECEYATSNYWLNVIVLEQSRAGSRDFLLDLCKQNLLSLRPAWVPLHKLPMFDSCPRMDLTVTENLASRLICLPSSYNLSRMPC